MSKVNLTEKYHEKCVHPSDINELLPYLKALGDDSETIIEMGVRGVVSTYAFLNSSAKKITSYDIGKYPDVEVCEEFCKENKRDWAFHKQDVLDLEIENCDLLFIDTYHAENQLKAELKLHSPKVNKYIAMHDTFTFGVNPEPPYEGLTIGSGGRGLNYAIDDFLDNNQDWEIMFTTKINNGLTVLRRKK